MRFQHRRREVLGLLATAVVGRATAQASAPDASFIDLMPAFWAAFDAHAGDAPPARAQALVDDFFGRHPDAYRAAGVKPTPADVQRWLPGLHRRAAAARQVHARFAHDYAANLARFRAALPDFDGHASPVTLMPSLLHFDAHLQPDGATLPLFFDPDAIVAFHGADADLAVLFSHELFHCYQGQRNPAMSLDTAAPLYASLWIEGTATYASERMNPGASPLHVLLDDQALVQAGDAALRSAARAMLANLDATDDATQAPFFQMGRHGADWPPRAGYAVGLRIARGLGARLSLPQMAALPAPQVRATLAQALQRLADGDAAPA